MNWGRAKPVAGTILNGHPEFAHLNFIPSLNEPEACPMLNRSTLMRLCVLLLISVTPATVFGQSSSFPERPLTMLIGFNPGGSTDIQGQVLAEVMSEQLGQPVNIHHFPGRGGSVAAAMLASSQDAGYVFQYGLSNPFVFTPLTAEASFEPASFRFVAGITLDQPALVTGPNTPFDTWEEMLAFARESGDLIYATQNAQDQYIMERIADREGFRLRILPTTGGAGMAPLVLSGDAELAFSGGTHSGYTDDGRMRVLASPTRERLMAYPDVPTLRELGYDLDMHAYRVVAVPADTPDDQVEELASALRVAIADPRFIAVTEERIRMPVTYVHEHELITLFEQQVEAFEGLTNDQDSAE